MNKPIIANFLDLIRNSSKEFGNRVFISSILNKDHDFYYKDLLPFLSSLSGFLDQNKIPQTAKVGVMLPNDITIALLFLCIPALKRVFVPINPKSSPEEVSYICIDAEVEFLVTLKTLKENVPVGIKSKLIELGTDWIDELLNTFNREEKISITIEQKEIAEIVYTSGTTGKPKGVELSHRNLISNSKGISDSFNFRKSDRFLTITPLFHNSGQLFTTLAPMWTGSLTIPVRPEVALGAFWSLVVEKNITWTLGMGSHINFLISIIGKKYQSLDHNLKGVLTGGMKLDEGKRRLFEDFYKTEIFITYGLTETTSFATCENKHYESSPGSVGRPMSINKIKIDSAPGKTEGEILIKGDNVFEKYHNLDNLTQERKSNGWLKTGDLGYLDDKGNLFITDRIDNLIIISGENVYPAEIEQHSLLIVELFEFMIVSKEHEIKGVELAMVFTLKHKMLPDIKGWSKILSTVLANYKIPTKFININDLGHTEIPKALNGKLLRSTVQNMVNDLI